MKTMTTARERENSSLVPATDLSDSKLAGSSLRRVRLAEAVLHRVDFRASDLQGAHLRKAQLFRANLKDANLYNANLGRADLRVACLEGANLCHVNLCRANLRGARLAGARLDESDLAEAILPDGTRYRDEADLAKFTDKEHPLFSKALAKVAALAEAEEVELVLEHVVSGWRRLPWSEFVDHYYGILADDPIERHPHVFFETEDTLE